MDKILALEFTKNQHKTSLVCFSFHSFHQSAYQVVRGGRECFSFHLPSIGFFQQNVTIHNHIHKHRNQEYPLSHVV